MSPPFSAALTGLAALGGESFGVSGGPGTAAADGAAAAMLGVILFVIALIAWFGWTMARRSRRPDETLRFLEDLKDGENQPTRTSPGSPAEKPRQPWEKPGDWWQAE